MASGWRAILNKIEKLQEKARSEGDLLWYRGQRLADWPIQSSLHRRIENDLRDVGRGLDESQKIELMRDVYKTLYQKFKARAWHLLDAQERSDWGIIFSMQHHGIPTRLLDWTESFVCALYFAHCGRKKSDDAAIFIINSQKLNKATAKREGLVALGENIGGAANFDSGSYHPRYLSSATNLETVAVAPVLSNPRMLAQQSTFILCGDSFQPLDERYKKFIKKIVLPAATYNDSRKFLDLVGTGHFKYFPDFVGLRDELIDKMDREVEVTREYLRRALSNNSFNRTRR